jgi:hypothetical protein
MEPRGRPFEMGGNLPESPPRPVWYAGPSTRLGESWTMLHPPYTAMVLSAVIAAGALAPRLSGTVLAATLLAYFLGLGIGAHFLDQIPGMGSRYVEHWSGRELAVVGGAGIAAAAGIGLWGSILFGGLPLLLLVAAQVIAAVGYPLAPLFRGLLHRESVFALTWGALPFLTSFYAQSGEISAGALVVAAAFAAVAVVEIRVSRLSRTLRSEAVRNGSGPRSPTGARPSYRLPDGALQALSAGTVLVALGLLALRLRWGG